MWAVDVAEGQPVRGPALSILEGSATVVSLHFACSLDALGLAPGEIEPRDIASDRVPLPRALGVQTLTVDQDGSSAWQALPGAPDNIIEALRFLPIDQQIDCTTTAPTLAIDLLPTAERRGAATFGIPLRSGEFLVGTALDNHVVFEATGRSRTVSIGVEGPFIAAYEAPDQTLWLLAKDGRVVSGRLGGSWAVETLVPILRRDPETDEPTSDFGALVGPDNSDDPFELYAATDDQTFVRFDGTRLTELTRTDRDQRDDGCDDLREPELLWVGPGRILAGDVARDCRAVTFFENNVPTIERFLNRRDRVELLERDPDGAAVLGTLRGEVWRRDDDGWTRLGSTTRSNAEPIIVIQDSMVVGSRLGLPGTFQWIQFNDGTVCPLPPANLPLVFAAWPTDAFQWLVFTRQRTFAFGEPEQELDFGVIRMSASPTQATDCGGGTISLQPFR